jgi:cyclic pyranopterin phosphate synthase
VTRGGNLDRVLAGIDAALRAGLTPVKFNSVLQRSTWKQEVPALLDYAAYHGCEIRFIELMRTGTERAWCESEFVSAEEVRRGLGLETGSEGEQGHAPACRMPVHWKGAKVRVGWITPRSRPFCHACERLRMNAQGQLRRCLMDPLIFDLPAVLGSMDDGAAQRTFQGYMAGKLPPNAMNSSFAMNQVGG